MKLRTVVLALGTLLAMAYDPRTGITTYGEVADSTAASDPAPSTATSLAAPAAGGPATAPLTLQAITAYNGMEQPYISGYRDQFGQEWRQGANGWERLGRRTYGADEYATPQESWLGDDPNASKWSLGFDASPYSTYLNYAAGDVPQALQYVQNGDDFGHQQINQEWLRNPVGLFDIGYNSGNRRSLNPYFSTNTRDALRSAAERLGLTAEDADRAALSYASDYFNTTGQGFSDAMHPAIVADEILKRIFAQAGEPYQGLSPEQWREYNNAGIDFQARTKEADQESWKRDDIAGMLGAWTEQMQNAWESGTNEGWLPSEQALLGADNPWNTWLINTVFNKEYDPWGNEVALPTEKNYQQASEQGYDVGAAALVNEVAKQAIMQYFMAEVAGDFMPAVGGAGSAGSGGADATGAFDQGLFAPQDMGLNPAASNGLLSASSAFAKKFALNLALSGGDYKAALKQTLLDAGVKYGASALNGLSDSAPADLPPDATPSEPDWKRRGMLALGDTSTTSDVTSGLFADASSPLMPPAILDTGGSETMPVAVLDTGGAAMMPSAVPEADPTFGGALQEYAPGLYMSPDYLSGPGPSEQPKMTPEQQRSQENAKMVQDMAKYARAIAALHDGDGEPADAPRREEGQDDAQYAQTLAKYANLDAQAMADAGLTPGTPEYYDYIMQQMDSIIGQVTDGLDPDDAALPERLRAKTREELDALERALYVRGQIGQMMGSGRYADPVTGISEDVIAPEGRTFRPGVAAYHRGLARSADELAAMRPQEARRFIGGMLGRNPDLYGMEASASDRAEEEALASQGDYDWKRRRGMLSGR